MKKFIKPILFVVVFLFLFNHVSMVLNSDGDFHSNQVAVGGFYKEKKNSLDAVYIGGSACYAFINPIAAWENHGLTIYPYATTAQQFIAAKYVIEEVHKSQPGCIIIANVNALASDNKVPMKMHGLFDYMPFSFSKMRAIYELSRKNGFSNKEMLEYFIPMTVYHSRWNQLGPVDFENEMDGLKGASYYSKYLKRAPDVSPKYNYTDESKEYSKEETEAIEDLLDYCDENDVKIQFICVPQARKTEYVMGFNAVLERIEKRGYPVLNLLRDYKDLDLDLRTDFYNPRHTNIHGSLKYTDWLCKYLAKQYGLSDKRGQKKYASWDEATKRYHEKVAPFVMNFEWDPKKRDFTLTMPENRECMITPDGVRITWKGVENASGYEIYRKHGEEGALKAVGETKTERYVDEITEEKGTYYYFVVPYVDKAGKRYYGNFRTLPLTADYDEQEGE